MKGTVSFFSTQGWGFIKSDYPDAQDYFVHHSGIATNDKFKMLMKDELVEFDVQPSGKARPLAINVKVSRNYKTDESKNEVKENADSL